ncbi:MAG: hypothetical protein HFF49_03240 [Lawsonibacter sp.]|jgi:hypothetical protein|nr:hypothetical protein [Lawsonibacter sp.]
MKKRIFYAVMLLLLVGILSAQMAQAVGQRAASQKPDLFFQGTTAICSAICQGDSATDSVAATLTLYQGNTYIDSWSELGTRKITLYGECKVTSGKTYRLELACSINGVDKPVVSVTNTCR